jgi:hypothetical protein
VEPQLFWISHAVENLIAAQIITLQCLNNIGNI